MEMTFGLFFRWCQHYLLPFTILDIFMFPFLQANLLKWDYIVLTLFWIHFGIKQGCLHKERKKVSTICWDILLFILQSLTVSAVLIFGAINSSICLQLQVVTLSTVQFGNYTLKLRLCKEKDGWGQLISCAHMVEKTQNSNSIYKFQWKKVKRHFL